MNNRQRTHATPHLPPVDSSQAIAAASPVADVLRSPGLPLDTQVRAIMEPRFGHDFSRVRVHADASAARAASSIGSSAFTVGQDIVFGPLQYAPSTHEGRCLLAHELTHVVQQGYSPDKLSMATVSASNDASEVEAGWVANQVAAGKSATVSERAPAGIQRSPGWDPNDLGIWFNYPANRQYYVEDGRTSERLSRDLPLYQGPFCQNVHLPFECNIDFTVDISEPRPRPFTAPHVSVEFSFAPARGGFTVSRNDTHPTYVAQGNALRTSFNPHFNFTLSENGPLTMTFIMSDPDTGITRTYQDTIMIEAKRPCA